MNREEKSNILILLLILLIGVIGQLASDIYAPALSLIAKDLHSTISLAQTSMAVYMFGMAATMVFYGIFSEAFGRRGPLIVGMALAIIGSLICVFSTNIDTLIVGRFITGCGTGAGTSLWRGIFRDRFSGDQMAKYGSYLTVIISFIVPAAPAIGGFFAEYLGWRSIFVLLIAYAILIAWIVWYKIDEVNQHVSRDRLSLAFIKQSTKELFSHRHFTGIILCQFLTYGAFFSWFSIGSALLVHHLGMTPGSFGLLNLIGGLIVTFGAGTLNGRVVERFGSTNMLRFGWSFATAAGILMLVLSLTTTMTVYTVFIPTMLFYFGCFFIWPNAFATATKPFGHIAGFAGSIYGFMQIAGGGVLGLLVAYLPNTSATPLSLVFIGSAVAALIIFETVVAKSNPKQQAVITEA
ncbi:MAG: multidrug effflux MFS transporter [Coxiellaceae bacterium]|nr:multidrug effflux MFS transporter [Coxiellaceae bacterium]